MKFITAITLFLSLATLANAQPTPMARVDGTNITNAAAWRNFIVTDGSIANGKLATNPLARANHTGTQSWDTITATPTTLSGYGIVDGVAVDNALSTEIAWLERFARHANGTLISNGSVTENGNTWGMSNQGGFSNMLIENGALVPQIGDLPYIGGTVACQGKRFSITAIGEFRTNSGYVSGSDLAALTFGINDIPFNGANLGAFLADGNGTGAIHLSPTNQGTVQGGFYEAPGEVMTVDETPAALNVPVGKTIAINLTVIGDVITVSIMGRTKTYRHPGVSDRIGDQTGFFIEPSRLNTQRLFWATKAVWVNSPSLDANQYLTTRDQLLGEMMTTDIFTLPGKLRVGGSTYETNKGPLASDPFAIAGSNNHLGYSAYIRPYAQASASITGILQGELLSSVLSSSAAANDQAIKNFPQLGSTFLVNGQFVKWRICGRFGTNGNTKRVKIKRSVGSVWFDSGDLTQNNTPYEIEWFIYCVGGAYRYHAKMTYGSPATILMQAGTMDENAQNQLLVTGTAAGDVTVDYFAGEVLKF